ncbi:MAG: peptide-methionine (S)-S-oxide reductase, partial [Vicinamibacterales bacterium]
MTSLRLSAAVGSVIALVAVVMLRAAPAAVALPDPQVDDALTSNSSSVSVVIAGGCFWGIEEVYQHVRGVSDAVS